MAEKPVGVFAAFSVGKWQDNDEGKGQHTLTLMRRPGGPDDPYGGYKEVTALVREHIPLHLDEVRLDGEKVEYERGKSYYDEDNGGPYRVFAAEDGVVEIETATDLQG